MSQRPKIFLTPLKLILTGVVFTVPLAKVEASQAQVPQTAIATSVTTEEWLSQLQSQESVTLVRITSVRLNPTAEGLEIALETATGKLSSPVTSIVGNVLIADFPNAILALPDGEEFLAAEPAEEIAFLSVTNYPENRVQVAITGLNVPPTAKVRTEARGLVLSVVPGKAQQTGEEEEDEIQVVVTGEPAEDDYYVPNATTGTRTDTPIRDIPQSIQVILRQVLEDQGITQIGEALRNVSGIGQPRTTDPVSGDYVTLRGFDPGSAYFVNGLRNPFGGNNINLEAENIEQIEVLKGPASVLYGQVEPGGIINITTRQPLSDPYYAFGGTIGNFDFYRPTLDFSGPLNSEETILYRLIGAYQNSGSFVDFIELESYFVAPVLSFQLGKNTRIALEGQYLDRSGISFNGLPASGTILSNPLGELPRDRFLGDPEAGGLQDRRLGSIGYRLDHKFSKNWSIRNAFRFDSLHTDEQYIFFTGLEDDNRTLNREVGAAVSISENYTLQTDAIGAFNTGAVEHDVVFGAELRRYTYAGEYSSAEVAPIDIFAPIYGISPGEFTLGSDTVYRQNLLGIYIQDLVSITDNLKLLLGGRFDLVDQQTDEAVADDSFSQEDTAFSPRIGIVYQPIQPISLYANFSRSFVPITFGQRNADGTPFEPTTGEQFEVGVKTEFLDGRAFATLAAYEITKQNIINSDPDRHGFSIQIGEQRSRGIELDVAGELFPGFNLIANYAYIDAEITKDTSGIEGNQPANVPQHSASLWATYEIQAGDLQGLGFGTGVLFVGERQGDSENTFEVPSFVRTDAAVYYRRDNWRVGLNIRNLFDVEYFEGAFSPNIVYYGAPFTILGTVEVKF
ncbi:TonB-dependent siderophore receptor [Pleurocapsales cyanobacterium LEGE 06147]|nr:TonB-dependent siderophore receptor [Pleurocapsales cyanobacterium LEGE 06147]